MAPAMRLLQSIAVVAAVVVEGRVPTVAELGTKWVDAVPLRSMAPVQNFWASVGLRGAPMAGPRRTDLISLDAMTLTPYHGNMVNSSMRINNEAVLVNMSKWQACEASRRSQEIRLNAGGLVNVQNDVRIGFETYVVMSRYRFVAVNGQQGTSGQVLNDTLDIDLSGPLFQHCEDLGGCGWGVPLPSTAQQTLFTFEVHDNFGVVYLKNSASQKHPVAAAITLYRIGQTGDLVPVPIRVKNGPVGSVFTLSDTIRSTDDEYVVMFTAGPLSEVYAMEQTLAQYSNRAHFDGFWADACGLWEQRWQQAFQPNNPHFSGNLPELTTNDSSIERTYYTTLLALVSLERTNLPLFERVYTISNGDVNLLGANGDMGGAGQFVWDLSFCATAYTLLDPAATKATLRHYTSHTVFPNSSTAPFSPPQSWDVFIIDPPIGGAIYAFDYYAAFLFFSVYIRLTNDVDFLHERIPGALYLNAPVTVLDYMELLATAYKRFPPISGTNGQLTDYGTNERHFLEVVPTYVGSVPALNFGNANMLYALGLIKQRGLKDSPVDLAKSAFSFSYNGDGTFNCLYGNGTKKNVRAISDFIYIAQQMCLLGGEELCDVLGDGKKQMADYAWTELYSPEAGFTRALSREDNLFKQNPHFLLIDRADWGAHGTYPGCTGMFVEAMAVLDGNYDRATELFKAASKVTYTDAWAQGIAVDTPEDFIANCSASYYYNYNNNHSAPKAPYAPAWPEYFADLTTWWPESLRGLANNAGAFGDAMIRTLFGFNPGWTTFNASGTPPAAFFVHTDRPRPFNATLTGLRLPTGSFVDVTASPNGVAVKQMDPPSH